MLAYNLGNLWRRPGLPQRIKSWSLTSLQHRLMKTGARLEGVKKSGLPQALAKRTLIRKDLDNARLAVRKRRDKPAGSWGCKSPTAKE